MKTGTNGTRIIITIVVIMLLIVVWKSPLSGMGSPKTVPYSTFLGYIDHNVPQIETVELQKDEAVLKFRQLPAGTTDKVVSTKLPDAPESRNALYAALAKNNITHEFKPPFMNEFVQTVLTMLLFPVGLIAVFYLFFIRQAQSGGNQALNFGRSKARRLDRQRAESDV